MSAQSRLTHDLANARERVDFINDSCEKCQTEIPFGNNVQSKSVAALEGKSHFISVRAVDLSLIEMIEIGKKLEMHLARGRHAPDLTF